MITFNNKKMTPKINIDEINSLLKEKKVYKAREEILTLLKTFNDDYKLLNLLAYTYESKSDYNRASRIYKKLSVVFPNNAHIYYKQGLALKKLIKMEEALNSFLHSLSIRQGDISTLNQIGLIYIYLDRADEAVKYYEKALAIDPNSTQTLHNLALGLKYLDDKEYAILTLEKLISLSPNNFDAHILLSGLKNYTDTKDNHLKQMRLLLIDEEMQDVESKIKLGFSLGSAYEKLNSHKKAYRYIEYANKLKNKTSTFSIQELKAHTHNIRAYFNRNQHSILDTPKYENAKSRPIFVLGMHRSGSTLVEQILGSTSDVYGAGELNYISILSRALLQKSIHSKAQKLQVSDFLDIRTKYLKYLDDLNFSESIVVDKMPHNFFYIGFILVAFPNAKIIHTNRTPMAVCWSMYKREFATDKLDFSYSFKSFGEFYKEYLDMMDFWKGLYPNQIYDIVYEKLTTDQEQESKKLLEFCEIEWQDDCIEFYKSDRLVKTASSQQVRKKMYKGSSEAWLSYESELQGLVEALSESTKRYEELL